MFALKPSALKNTSLGLANGIAVRDTSLSPITSFITLLFTILFPVIVISGSSKPVLKPPAGVPPLRTTCGSNCSNPRTPIQLNCSSPNNAV